MESTVYIHLLHHNQTVGIAAIAVSAGAQLGDGDIPPNLLLGHDLLLQPCGRPLGELVVPLLLHPLVGLDVVPHHLRRLPLLDHTDVDVGA